MVPVLLMAELAGPRSAPRGVNRLMGALAGPHSAPRRVNLSAYPKPAGGRSPRRLLAALLHYLERPRALSVHAAGGARRHPALPYTPDNESLLNAAESSGGLTLPRLRPLATERGPSFRSVLHFPIEAKRLHDVTEQGCEGNFCGKHVHKRSKNSWSHYYSKTRGKSDNRVTPNWKAANLRECVHFLAHS